jgi:hypothetical protein
MHTTKRNIEIKKKKKKTTAKTAKVKAEVKLVYDEYT